jgi:hypothetical protein
MKKELIREKKKSLADRYPELAKEWHTELNGDLTPYDVTPYSQIKVWWKTEEGKEFQAVVRYRTTNYLRKDKNLIPEEISGKYRKREEKDTFLKKNNLVILFPEVAKEWDYEKNDGVKPEEVFSKSGKTYWFKCANGHSWQTRVINRTSKGSKCPVCTLESRKLINTTPELIDEFDPVKNKKINLFDLTASSNEKVWWICKNCSKKYKESVQKRVKGYKCPVCFPVKKEIPYEKSLEYNYPEIAKQWNYELNGNLTPKDVRPMSGKSVWWNCPVDKEHPPWKSIIHNRTYNGNGCPTCNNPRF